MVEFILMCLYVLEIINSNNEGCDIELWVKLGLINQWTELTDLTHYECGKY